MTFIQGELYNYIEVFFLVLMRTTGLFMVAPIFGRRSIPAYFKIGFSFFLALIIVTKVIPDVNVTYVSFLDYFFLCLKEIIVGITLGYVGYLVFATIYFAGQMIDTQIGFGVVNVMDPQSNIQIPITSNFYYILAMLIFITSRGHYLIINNIYKSFKILPIGDAVFNIKLLNEIILLFGNIFIIGFKIFAPIIAIILVTDIALGIITKTVSQLNVFVIGMPLKIILGLVVILVSIPSFAIIIEMLISGVDIEMNNVMNYLLPKG